MEKMTEENPSAAFAGESQAHMRYPVFASKAGQEGKPNAARLFRATAFTEQVHATDNLRMLGRVGSTPENPTAAIRGETFEVEKMYPAYLTVPRHKDESGAPRDEFRTFE